MQDIPAERKKRGPSSLVLQEVIRQAPEEYVTVGWLTSTLHRHSFGIIMLSLGLLATTPVGSTVPGLILAVIAVQLIVGLCRLKNCKSAPMRRSNSHSRWSRVSTLRRLRSLPDRFSIQDGGLIRTQQRYERAKCSGSSFWC